MSRGNPKLLKRWCNKCGGEQDFNVEGCNPYLGTYDSGDDKVVIGRTGYPAYRRDYVCKGCRQRGDWPSKFTMFLVEAKVVEELDERVSRLRADHFALKALKEELSSIASQLDQLSQELKSRAETPSRTSTSSTPQRPEKVSARVAGP